MAITGYRPITRETKIVPTTPLSRWQMRIRDEGLDVDEELEKFHAYMKRATMEDIIPGEVSHGGLYVYFKDDKMYNWFVMRWGT